ncbi:MAG TPA: winged helix-turn-helix domain-containing protein [Terriglobia bacterium]|nr:winged helix-turn-helix domain-containing protein [Terriglobia bacterium]
MVDKDPTTVQAAFEILLEEMETEIEVINQSGAKAFAARNYDAARAVLERADQITALREKLAGLRNEWEKLVPVAGANGAGSKKNGSHDLSRLHRGIRTREVAYFKPILQVLNQMGGFGDMADVLERLPKLMKGTLTDLDFEPLAANSEVPRWWNTAQWAQSAMVAAGLLKSDSPRGIWEMTEAGHKLIAEFAT